jgi:hypothetical protein
MSNSSLHTMILSAAVNVGLDAAAEKFDYTGPTGRFFWD